LADKSAQLVLGALGRAAAEPAGLPLHGTRAEPGLFAANAVGKQAAQRCKDEGYLRVLHTETRGKATREVCAITEKGLAHLLTQTSPRQVLEDFLRALEARQAQAGELLTTARQMQASLEALRSAAERALQQLRQQPAPGVNGTAPHDPDPAASILSHLGRWQASGAAEDCPLPDLYRQARAEVPGLTVGRFHDTLRRLNDEAKIYLHPWTGPLYDLPEPPYALLTGHEIAYYASLRQG
jgi:hypothetical protein